MAICVKRDAKSEVERALLARYIRLADRCLFDATKLNYPLTKQDRKHFLRGKAASFLYESRARANLRKLAAVCLFGYRNLSTCRVRVDSQKRSELKAKKGKREKKKTAGVHKIHQNRGTMAPCQARVERKKKRIADPNKVMTCVKFHARVFPVLSCVQFNVFHSQILYHCALQCVIANFAPALAHRI